MQDIDTSEFDAVSLGIMWDRLVSLTDEIVSTLVRSSFSTIVSESYDLSCVVLDADAHTIAQGTFSVPAFIGSAPVTARHMLERFPPETLKPGDIIITNDPWLGTGHLFDITMMRPVFRNGRIVAYTVSITHLPDIGGTGFGSSATEVYQEGLRLPILKLYEAGSSTIWWLRSFARTFGCPSRRWAMSWPTSRVARSAPANSTRLWTNTGLMI